MAHSGHICRNAKEKTKLTLASENQNFFRLVFRTIVLSRALRLGRAVSLRRMRKPRAHQLRDYDRNVELPEHRLERGQDRSGCWTGTTAPEPTLVSEPRLT